MKNHFSAVSKLVAAAVFALSLGSCSRAEYAMLPKSASYHGVARVATPVPVAAPATTVAPAAVAAAETAPAPVVVAAPAAKEVASVTTTSATITATPASKLNLGQRLAISKLTHKMDKLVQKSGSVRQHDNTASTSKTAAISGNLRTGLILLLVGLLVGIFNGLIGTIIALIGVIFIVLWLLDSL